MTHAHAEVARSIRSAAAKTNKHGEPPLSRRVIGGEPPLSRRVIARQAATVKTRNRSASLARHSKLTYIDAVEETTD
mgnify:CR=1 FL=1